MTEEIRQEMWKLMCLEDSLPMEKDLLNQKAKLLKEREEVYLPWSWYQAKAQIEFLYDTKLYRDGKEQIEIKEKILQLEETTKSLMEIRNNSKSRISERMQEIDNELYRIRKMKDDIQNKLRILRGMLKQ